jgi:hypothetical protein
MNAESQLSKGYLFVVLLLMLVLPLASTFIDRNAGPFIDTAGKWFVFWAIGIRLFSAGMRQVMNPLFTLQQIFLIDDPSGAIVVRELGFANICFGATGIAALFLPAWRPAAAFAGGLYMGIAGVYHLVKKPESPNEVLAMVSDLYILAVMGVYLLFSVAV